MTANYPVTNKERHVVCGDSSTPAYKPSNNLKDMWVNSNARPAVVPDRRRHRNCQVPSGAAYTSLEHKKPKRPAGVRRIPKTECA